MDRSSVEAKLANRIADAREVIIIADDDTAYRASDADCGVIIAALRDRARWMASDTRSGERKPRRKLGEALRQLGEEPEPGKD
jgi:hypothetical protein